jgi:hypothetical protein
MQRFACLPGMQIPQGGLHSGLGHAVTANGFQNRSRVGRPLERCLKYKRDDEVEKDVPRRAGGLVILERAFRRSGFTKTHHSLTENSDEKDSPLRGPPKAGFEERHQRHLDLAKFNLIEFHGKLSGIHDV